MENNITNQVEEKLREFGILNQNGFTNKLDNFQIESFLNGNPLVAEDKFKRLTIQILENGAKVDILAQKFEKPIENLIRDAKEKQQPQFSNVDSFYFQANQKEFFTKKMFFFNPEEKVVKEFDLLKNSKEATKEIFDRKNNDYSNLYKTELERLKGYLQDKMDKFPHISKIIQNNINILDNEISVVATNMNPKVQEQNEVRLDVNDPDTYQDANREIEEKKEEEEESQENINDIGYSR